MTKKQLQKQVLAEFGLLWKIYWEKEDSLKSSKQKEKEIKEFILSVVDMTEESIVGSLDLDNYKYDVLATSHMKKMLLNWSKE